MPILVVDDNEQNRALLQATLEDEAYEVLVAANGEQALELFEARQPRCVLLDVRMPGMDGFEVCRRIRSLPHGSETAIVFLTAQRDVETFDAAQEAGGDDFLTKPLQTAELLLRVRAAIRLHRMGAELREQYDLVRHQRDDLMRLHLLKERLSSFVVHDLKNPVNAMDLRAQMALRDPDLPERARNSLLKIREETRNLSRLIMNLLDISKGEGGVLSPRTGMVATEAWTEEVISEFAPQAQAAEVKLAWDVQALQIVGDVDLLRRVLANLIDNAIRHAPEDSTVRIVARADGEHLRLEVIDEGPGIPDGLRERVFDPYVQIQTNGTTRGGRGLGLAFCRTAVEAHGGTIVAEPGGPGATIVVRLPLTQAGTPESATND